MLKTFRALAKHRSPLELIPILAILALAIIARLVPGDRTIDDAYITFRYARNILAGNGFVYNPGERVLGTTTPLYTILLALIGFFLRGVHTNFALVAITINALADATTCILLYALGKHFGKVYAGYAAALVWAIAPFSVTFAIGGLETSLYILLLTSTVYAYLHSRYNWCALGAALALLTRPDALLLLLPLGIDKLIKLIKTPARSNELHRVRWRVPITEALILIIPLAAWEAFAMLYFGSLFPNSIAAKSVAYLLPQKSAFIRLLQHYATPFLGHLTFGIPWIGIGLVIYPFLYLIGVRRSISTNPRVWTMAVYPWLYFLAFSIANPLIFRWYLSPPLPALQFFILVGVECLIKEGLAPRLQKYPLRIAHQLQTLILVFFVIVLPFSLTARGWTMHPDHGIQRPAPEMAWYLLELKYREAAEYLLERYSSSNLAELYLAAGDVGVLGYFTHARILDTVGLNSPVAISYYPVDASQHVNAYAVPARLILDEKPDLIVLLEVYGRMSLFKEPEFWEKYELIHLIPTDIYGSHGLYILQKREKTQ